MEQLTSHFPGLTEKQLDQFARLEPLYKEWNAKINVISRKDIDEFSNRHLMHSLALGLFTQLKPGSRVLDVGTGGGFPGIPLAILFPESNFVLVDSIGKKIKVVKAVAEALDLTNVEAHHMRAEEVPGQFDYVISRAVTRLLPLYRWVAKKIDFSKFANSGFYGLKGGDLTDEINEFEAAFRDAHVERLYISDKLKDPFFETKQIIAVS